MVLDLPVKPHDTIPTRLSAAIERAATPDTRSSYDADTFFSDSFIRRHTEFESTEEFYRACPGEQGPVGGIQHVPVEERDEFVAATTDFEAWSEMKERSALADLVTLTNT